jgi:hypothetical protein
MYMHAWGSKQDTDGTTIVYVTLQYLRRHDRHHRDCSTRYRHGYSSLRARTSLSMKRSAYFNLRIVIHAKHRIAKIKQHPPTGRQTKMLKKSMLGNHKIPFSLPIQIHPWLAQLLPMLDRRTQ